MTPAHALDAAMGAMSAYTLSQAVGCGPTAISTWRAGRSLPSVALADRVGLVLGVDLAATVTAARTRVCPSCGTTFVTPRLLQRFCKPHCGRHRNVSPGDVVRPQCMDDAEWQLWRTANGECETPATSPCVDCCPPFADEMRRRGTCVRVL